MQKLMAEINKKNIELKSIKSEHEVERKTWEDKLLYERSKFDNKYLSQQLSSLKEKHNQMKINIDKEKKEMAGQISLLIVTNGNLMQRLKSIEESADVIRTTNTIEKLTNDLHRTQVLLKDEKEVNTSAGFKLHTLLQATKDASKEKDKILEMITGRYEDLVNERNKLSRELKEEKVMMKENEELMMMTNEEMLQVKLKQIKLRETLASYQTIIAEENEKISELEMQLKLQREGLVQKKEVSMEGALFYFAWNNAKSDPNNKNKSSARLDKEVNLDPSGESDDSLEVAEKVSGTGEIKLDSISIRKYYYLKPNYKAFATETLPKPKDGMVSYMPSFPIWLHVTIRAIFDSKMNEVLFAYNKGKIITRFPEYVYSWLGTFYIDKDKRIIKELEYTEKETIATKNRSDLLLGLESASAAKLWEVSLFKDFLEEELGLDELVYFLHCRFLLFRGSQLAVPTAGFCVTHFVSKEKVHDLIDRIMYSYSADEKKTFKDKLAKFCKLTYKDANAYDYGMVLRILVEFYRKEKKENFARFEQLFNTTKHNIKHIGSVFPFSGFSKLMAGNYDKNISDIDLCNLYREAYIGGGCSVTCDSVLLSFCESNFWIKYLRLKGQNHEPKYDSRGDIDQSDDKGKECAEVHEYSNV